MNHTLRKNILFYGTVTILTILLVFLHFHKLGVESVKSWDESIYGVNGLEMLKTGEYIVNTYGYEPDFFNLKPVLWPQIIMLGFKAFGRNMIGLRVFSSLFMIITAASCTFFAYNNYGRKSALFVLLCFAANRHMIIYHCGRSGDADSLFVLLCTGAFLALSDTKKGVRRLYICALCFSFAFLTKSFHAGVIAAVAIMFIFSSGEYRKVHFRDIAICILISVLPVFCWAGLRYSKDGAAFFRTMFSYDLIGSVSGPLEGHDGNLFFYIKNLLIRSPMVLACILIILPVLMRYPKRFCRNKTRYALLLSVLLPFVMFSIARTKLNWYVYPCFPPLIVLAADCMEELLHFGNRRLARMTVGLAVALCLVASAFTFRTICEIKPQDKVLISIQDILNKSGEYNGEILYQHYVDPETQLMHKKWRPSALFTFELNSTLRPRNGNADEWKKDAKALLFISRRELNKLSHYRLRAYSGDYCIIEHMPTELKLQ